MENTAETNFSKYENLISEKLDDFGKSLSEEFFQTINALLLTNYPKGHEDGLRAFMNQLGIGASFVFDSNAIQKIIRYQLKGGKSSALSAIKSGFVTALAPPNIDFEIANHASEIADYCEVTPIDVLKLYHIDIRPHIQLLDVSDQQLFEKVKAQIKDKDDAPFLVLGLETESIGIVSEDGVFEDQEGVNTYRLEDLAQIHVHCRKRGVVIFLGILNVIAFVVLIKTIYSLFKMIFNFIKNNPKLVLGTVAAAGFIYFVFRKEINQKVKEAFGDSWEKFKNQANLIWKDLSPYFFAAFMQICLRLQETKKELKQLTKGKAEKINSFRLKVPNSSMPLEKWIEQILLAIKGPISLKELRAALKTIGFKPRGKNTIYYEVRKALESNPSFIKDSAGNYSLNA